MQIYEDLLQFSSSFTIAHLVPFIHRDDLLPESGLYIDGIYYRQLINHYPAPLFSDNLIHLL